ncbi:PREDICTED: uncharacterized protein LOC105558495 [Vollenhovia emeryi]|uniref:uncharacterized protein LOC105558495 n=1 Tax=Vollenhovia emeryi TaxID=411798 RepID=UPI0005F519D3|nr:PREDICTED: uncharacterized protein LOC105558495 [Vollenhovia emeryi]
MEHPEEYYKLSRFLLSVTGLNPYQSKRSAHLMRAVITVVELTDVYIQVSAVFLSDITMDYIVDSAPTLLIILGSLMNLGMRFIYIDKFRELFDRMSKDWAEQKTHYELKIMHKHAELSRLFGICYFSKRNIKPRFVYRKKRQAYACEVKYFCVHCHNCVFFITSNMRYFV